MRRILYVFKPNAHVYHLNVLTFLLVTGSADEQGISQTATFTRVASDRFTKFRALDAFFTAGTQLTGS
jgi:hypothetical protein